MEGGLPRAAHLAQEEGRCEGGRPTANPDPVAGPNPVAGSGTPAVCVTPSRGFPSASSVESAAGFFERRLFIWIATTKSCEPSAESKENSGESTGNSARSASSPSVSPNSNSGNPGSKAHGQFWRPPSPTFAERPMENKERSISWITFADGK